MEKECDKPATLQNTKWWIGLIIGFNADETFSFIWRVNWYPHVTSLQKAAENVFVLLTLDVVVLTTRRSFDDGRPRVSGSTSRIWNAAPSTVRASPTPDSFQQKLTYFPESDSCIIFAIYMCVFLYSFYRDGVIQILPRITLSFFSCRDCIDTATANLLA